MQAKLEQRAEQLAALGHPVRLAALRYVVQAGAEGASARVICWGWRRAWEAFASVQLPASTLALRADGRGFAAAGESLLLAEIPE